jgi:hypothetical protein
MRGGAEYLDEEIDRIMRHAYSGHEQELADLLLASDDEHTNKKDKPRDLHLRLDYEEPELTPKQLAARERALDKQDLSYFDRGPKSLKAAQRRIKKKGR